MKDLFEDGILFDMLIGSVFCLLTLYAEACFFLYTFILFEIEFLLPFLCSFKHISIGDCISIIKTNKKKTQDTNAEIDYCRACNLIISEYKEENWQQEKIEKNE